LVAVGAGVGEVVGDGVAAGSEGVGAAVVGAGAAAVVVAGAAAFVSSFGPQPVSNVRARALVAAYVKILRVTRTTVQRRCDGAVTTNRSKCGGS
jgi:hypothetical protein